MSFREKIHWVAFVGLLLGFGWYFLSYPWDIAGSRAGMMTSVWMLIPVTIIFLVPMILGTAYFAIRYPKEANLKEDEREKIIHLKGTHAAYYPLVLGVWANIFAMINGAVYGWSVNILMATLVLSELVRVGAQLYFYRRGY
ncbi:hypothetical protein ACFOWX_04020 [Sphingorhabdus arenilitoris]|uniref:DUF2178 domain-containing protein n=1 Tax=Sphingorhabdus arenilitoris TaxID=1490041 RepID=A0ABV8RF62_9SPHN